MLLAAVLAAPLAMAEPDGGEAQRAVGQAIYRDGVLGSGQPLTGLAPAGLLRQGRDAACVACHRRSGFGIAEGNLVVPPITAPDLFHNRPVQAATPRIAHQLGTARRPAYDDAALASAIRTGADVTGHPMHSMMPRYALGERDMAALLAYLRTLYAAPDPAVDVDAIHLATVIQPGVRPERRRALMEVIQAFVRDKNAGVRSEVARRKGGAMRMHRAYRRWVLDVWELEGEAAGWGAQLEAHYRRQPVFALVSGLGEQGWQPIEDFSERAHVPCILPLTSLPGTSRNNFYTVYFSRGVALEAEALASYLGRQAASVIQMYRSDDPASNAAAAALRAAWPRTGVRLEEKALDSRADDAFWRGLAGSEATLVLWLRAADLPAAQLGALRPDTYLSATLLDGAPPPVASTLRMTYPWELPALRAPRVRRSADWLRARGLGGEQLQLEVNAHFALTMVGEALAHLMDSFSREYFVETIEHNLSTTLLASFFPPLTLGPDQRFGSKGVYLVQGTGPATEPVPIADLIVP